MSYTTCHLMLEIKIYILRHTWQNRQLDENIKNDDILARREVNKQSNLVKMKRLVLLYFLLIAIAASSNAKGGNGSMICSILNRCLFPLKIN